MDISAGYDAYLASRRAASPPGWSEALRKFRKFQRDYALQFEWHANDERVFHQLLRWKSEQYLRSDLPDYLKEQWRVDLLSRIWRTQSNDFGGVLSAIYANGILAAVHFSMQSGAYLHSWFPAYNVDFARYSPGSALLLLMAKHASSHGVDYIDLGKGPESYKKMFASWGVLLAEGAVDTRAIARMRRVVGRGRRGLNRLLVNVSTNLPGLD